MRQKEKIVAAVFISAVLIAILLSQVQIADIIVTIAKIDIPYLIAGFILYACSYLFRALRFYALLHGRIGLRDLFSIVCIHNMMNNLLPARTGELSYIYLVRHRIAVSDGIASLMIARVFDLIAISTLFFIAAISSRNLPDAISRSLPYIATLMLIAISSLFLIAYKGSFVQNLRHRQKIKILKFLAEKLEEIIESFDMIKSKNVVIYCFFSSMVIWVCLYFTVYVLLISVNVNLSLKLIILGATFSLLINILPIPSIGNFGPYEGVWALAFFSFGLPKIKAISTGFMIHIVITIYYLILGCYGFIKLRSLKPNTSFSLFLLFKS